MLSLLRWTFGLGVVITLAACQRDRLASVGGAGPEGSARTIDEEQPPAPSEAAEEQPAPLDRSVERILARFSDPKPGIVLRRNDDGTILIRAEPRFEMSELGCQILVDSEGNEFPNVHTLLCFDIEGTRYAVRWGSRTSRAPFRLDSEQTYDFLLLPPQKKDRPFAKVLKIWRERALVFDRSESGQ